MPKHRAVYHKHLVNSDICYLQSKKNAFVVSHLKDNTSRGQYVLPMKNIKQDAPGKLHPFKDSTHIR